MSVPISDDPAAVVNAYPRDHVPPVTAMTLWVQYRVPGASHDVTVQHSPEEYLVAAFTLEVAARRISVDPRHPEDVAPFMAGIVDSTVRSVYQGLLDGDTDHATPCLTEHLHEPVDDHEWLSVILHDLRAHEGVIAGKDWSASAFLETFTRYDPLVGDLQPHSDAITSAVHAADAAGVCKGLRRLLYLDAAATYQLENVTRRNTSDYVQVATVTEERVAAVNAELTAASMAVRALESFGSRRAAAPPACATTGRAVVAGCPTPYCPSAAV